MSKDGDDNLTVLTNVQRQLVQKSFQTYVFEAKIRAKDRDDEHATTANEVLEQALRTHAASVASLHFDGVPSADDYRQRLPKKSLGRYQYEDLTRMTSTLAPESPPYAERVLAVTAAAAAAAAANPPSPRQPLPQSQPSQQLANDACSSGSPTSTGDGSGSSSGGGNGAVSTGDGSAGGAEAFTSASPRSAAPWGGASRGGSWRQRRGEGPPLHRTTSGLGVFGVAGSHSRTHTRLLPPRGSGGCSGGGDGGGDGSTEGTATAAVDAAGRVGCGLVLHRTDSGLRRAEQMLMALREIHDPSGPAAGSGTGASHALPAHLPRPPAPPGQLPSYSSMSVSGATSPSLATKHRHGYGYVPSRQPNQVPTAAAAAVAHPGYVDSRNLSVTGSAFTAASRSVHHYHNMRSRSPHMLPPFSRSVDSIPRAQPPPPPPPPPPQALAPSAEVALSGPAEAAAVQDGFELAPVGRSGSSLSFSAALWRPPPPPPESYGTVDATPGGLGAPPPLPAPPPHGRGIRFSSATNDTEEPISVPVGGGGGGGFKRQSAGWTKMTAGGVIQLSAPPAPATEQLFTRISRSTARAAPQQRWVQLFDSPLPASPSASTSVFTAAACGASPYAAPGLGLSGVTEAETTAVAATGEAADAGRRPHLSSAMSQRPLSAFDGGCVVGGGCPRPPLAPSQRPLSGAPSQTTPQSPAAAEAGVKLPPIPDASDGSFAFAAPGAAREARAAGTEGRVRPSLSWSIAEGPTSASFAQRARQIAGAPRPAPDTRATGSDQRRQQQQEQESDAAFRRVGRVWERSISTDGELRRKIAGAAVAQPPPVAAEAMARVELVGTAAEDRRAGPGGGLSYGGDAAASAGGNGGVASPHAKPRRAVARGNAGSHAGGGGARDGVGGGGSPGGSPSMLTRMRKALGNIWPRSPGRS